MAVFHHKYLLIPASQWVKPENGVDLYDVRRRPWYARSHLIKTIVRRQA